MLTDLNNFKLTMWRDNIIPTSNNNKRLQWIPLQYLVVQERKIEQETWNSECYFHERCRFLTFSFFLSVMSFRIDYSVFFFFTIYSRWIDHTFIKANKAWRFSSDQMNKRELDLKDDTWEDLNLRKCSSETVTSATSSTWNYFSRCHADHEINLTGVSTLLMIVVKTFGQYKSPKFCRRKMKESSFCNLRCIHLGIYSTSPNILHCNCSGLVK